MRRILLLISIFLLNIPAGFAQNQHDFSYEKKWAIVDSLYALRLSRSSLEVIEEIYIHAHTEKNAVQQYKAITSKWAMRSTIFEKDRNAIVKDFQQKITEAQPELKALLYSLLGELYDKQFDHYSIRMRPIGNSSKLSDLENKSVEELYALARESYLHSLDHIDSIDNNLDVYKEILVNDDSSKPEYTLRELLMRRAIRFFSQSSWMRDFQFAKKENFPEATSFFVSTEQFLTKELLKSNHPYSNVFQIYQQLLQHLKRTKKGELFAFFELERLKFCKSIFSKEETHTRYPHYLQELFQSVQEIPFSTEVLFSLAEYQRLDTDELKESVETCQHPHFEKFPDTLGTANCQFLIDIVSRPKLAVVTPTVILPNKPTFIKVEHLNVDTLFVKAVRVNAKTKIQFQENRRYRDNYFESLFSLFSNPSQEVIIDSLGVPIQAHNDSLFTESIILSTENDYKTHTKLVPLNGLPLGHYLLFFGSCPSVEELNKEAFSAGFLDVSNIAFSTRKTEESFYDEVIEVLALDRKTGKALRQLPIEFTEIFEKPPSVKHSQHVTDKEGIARIHSLSTSVLLSFELPNDTLITSDRGTHWSNIDEPKWDDKTLLYLDRHIYRLGQTVYYKGIRYKEKDRDWRLLTNAYTIVNLRDANHRRIDSDTLKTNKFGSYSGSFTLPNDGLTGDWYLETVDTDTRFSVEAYKRPSFELVLDKFDGAYTVGDTLTISGKAFLYTGSPLTQANGKISVTFHDHLMLEETITTDSTGYFALKYPTHHTETGYSVEFEVTITDSVGETVSKDTNVLLGLNKKYCSFGAPFYMNISQPNSISIDCGNDERQPVPFSGTLRILKMKNPETYYLPLEIQASSLVGDVSLWKQHFPHYDVLPDTFEIEHQLERIMVEKEIEAVGSFEEVLSDLVDWETGLYLMDFVHKDTTIILPSLEKRFFQVYTQESKRLAFPQAFFITPLATTVNPGEKADVVIGTSLTNIRLLMEIEVDRIIIQKKWLTLSNEQRILSIPVTKEHLGNFAVHFFFVKENHSFSQTFHFSVPMYHKTLDISLRSFRDELTPKEHTRWQLTIKDHENRSVFAEVLASMYDASLDVFQPKYSWYQDRGKWTIPKLRTNYNYYRTRTHRNVSTQAATRISASQYAHISSYSIQPKLDLFDLNIQKFKFVKPKDLNSKTATLLGRVLDAETGDPLPGAQVIFVGTKIGTTTDINGSFSVPDIPEGNHIVKVSFVGFENQIVAIRIDPDYDTYIEVHLETSSDLSEVVVMYERPLVTREEIGFLPIRGVISNLNIRGGRDEDVLAYTDGKVNPDLIFDRPLMKGISEAELRNTVPRRNFQETAFFYPHIRTNIFGNLVIEFTAPESLTRWKFRALGHTRKLQFGQLEEYVTTSQPFMVQVNPPRFLREGDTFTLTARVTNNTQETLDTAVQLFIFDAQTMQPLDDAFSNQDANKPLPLRPNRNESVGWTLQIPSDIDAIVYRVVGSTAKFSDGEERTIPVIKNNSILVTESLPLWSNGTESNAFTFDHLKDFESKTLIHHLLKLEVTTNPYWEVVASLPYLIEFPHECAEQSFSRYFANLVASKMLNEYPALATIPVEHADDETSPFHAKLLQNPELKSLFVEETPWVTEAYSSEEAVKNIFEKSYLTQSTKTTWEKLTKLQLPSGAWGWFQGMRANRYITQHILMGFGYLQKFELLDKDNLLMVERGFRYLDVVLEQDYRNLKTKPEYESNRVKVDAPQIQYLFARSFFDIPFNGPLAKEAHDYYYALLPTQWQSNTRQLQAMIALILYRGGDIQEAEKVLAMFKEQTIFSEEQGYYWKEAYSTHWYEAPLETQALILHAFQEITDDTDAVLKIQRHLLRNKQVIQWKNTRSTTLTIASLMLGSNTLEKHNLVTVQLGDETIQTPPKEDNIFGTISKTWNPKEFDRNFANLSIQGSQNIPTWGALHWQYFENLDNITSSENGLAIEKKFLRQKQNTDVWDVYDTHTPLNVGDLIRVQLLIQSDREMEFVHLKDLRPAGLEPIQKASGYYYENNLGYYLSIKDVATHFFFDRLRRGTHVLTYDLRVVYAGDFSTGIATIENMYAPAFNAHSNGFRIQAER